jgi:gluconokinase
MLQTWPPPPRPLVVVLMGVTASGKMTAGEALAARWGWPYVDGNDVHPPANVAKMRSGTPLTDADRRPWLEALHRMAEDVLAAGDGAIIGCSALKASYRAILRGYLTRVAFVWLDVPRAELEARMAARQNHFMPPALLDSQLATLETPSDALRVDGTGEVDAVVRRIAEAVTTWQRNDVPPPPI